jgi:hypothetical protein
MKAKGRRERAAKKPVKSPAPPEPVTPRSQPPSDGPRSTPAPGAPRVEVRVRMYRQGLGDCFLVTIADQSSGKSAHLLIDCGLLMAPDDDEQLPKIEKVARHIAEETSNHLDVLAATHEHWDHLSGFKAARDVFDRITVGEVWVAWTEDPSNPRATHLRLQRAASLTALQAAADRLRQAQALGAADEQTAERAEWFESVLQFHGGFEDKPDPSVSHVMYGGALGASAGKPKSPRTAEAMHYVVSKATPRFLKPGQPPLRFDGIDGVRVFVLGPPQDWSLLTTSNPREGEVYEKSLALDETGAFLAAVFAAADPHSVSNATQEVFQPFDSRYRVPMEKAHEVPVVGQHHGFPPGHSQDDPDWRRVDTDWLHAAETLALQLDSNTNNTSLVLAIELVESGKVLLFAADAQVGNWLSWQGLKWTDKDGLNQGEEVTGPDLLRRTVFYKVGHHASHNATLRGKGLELMTSPDLVAMIPVDEKTAHKPKPKCPKGWDMPFGPLLDRLMEKTKGRVIRLDHGLPRERPKQLSPGEWDDFSRRCEQHPENLYVEYKVLG